MNAGGSRDEPPIPPYMHVSVRDAKTTHQRALEAGTVSV